MMDVDDDNDADDNDVEHRYVTRVPFYFQIDERERERERESTSSLKAPPTHKCTKECTTETVEEKQMIGKEKVPRMTVRSLRARHGHTTREKKRAKAEKRKQLSQRNGESN
jgi:hypothetical protein